MKGSKDPWEGKNALFYSDQAKPLPATLRPGYLESRGRRADSDWLASQEAAYLLGILLF